MQDLQIGNISKRATPENYDEIEGYERNNAKAKSGVIKAILDVAWGVCQQMNKLMQIYSS
jgi:hypothetical protein